MKTFIFLVVTSFLLPCCLYASSDQGLAQASQQATVISAKKLDRTSNYAYDVGFQVGCTLYVARYKSANDYVPPQSLTPESTVNVRPEKHWLHVFLPLGRSLEMRIVSTSALGSDACHDNAPAMASEALPAGTILPVSLNSTIRSDKSQIGDTITATVMQDVPLRSDGISLPKGSKITGHVTQVVRQGQKSDESIVSFQFDQLQMRGRTVPVSTNLRALASAMAVSETHTPRTSTDNPSDWNLVPIGGDEISYGQGGPVIQGSEIVGENTGQGTLAYATQDINTECRGSVDGNGHAQAFWVFSSQACGVYWYGDVKILHSGRNNPIGQVTLISEGKALNLGKGSGMLLRVDGVSDKAAAQATVPTQALSQ